MNALELRVKEIIEENGGAEYAQDVLAHGCISGVVMELVEEYEEMLGEKLNWDGDMKNWFAWFSFEETTRKPYEM